MAVTLAGQIEVKGQFSYENPLALSTPSDRVAIGMGGFDAILDTFTTGTGATAGNADRLWHDKRTLAATTADNLDLAGGLTDPITGLAITFNRIKLILIDLDAPDTGIVLHVGPGVPGASNPWIGPWAQVASNYVRVYDTLYLSNRTDG